MIESINVSKEGGYPLDTDWVSLEERKKELSDTCREWNPSQYGEQANLMNEF